jgi:adenosine/AMP kinase
MNTTENGTDWIILCALADEMCPSHRWNFPPCSFCHKPKTDLRLLSCLHSICVSCHRQMMSRDINQQSSEISCDRCKIELNDTHELEVEISSESPINHYFNKLKTSVIHLGRIPFQCSVCNTRVGSDVMNYCTECEQHLCIICREGHTRISATRDHHIVLAKNWLPLNVKNTCKNHRDKLMLFCRDCT